MLISLCRAVLVINQQDEDGIVVELIQLSGGSNKGRPFGLLNDINPIIPAGFSLLNTARYVFFLIIQYVSL